MPAPSARSSARDSSAQARGVENGTGSAGTGRISASGMWEMKLRISARTPFLRRPGQPFVGIDPQVQDGDAVDQRRAHRAHQRAVLHAVAGRDHPGARRQRVLAEPALQQQRVERLLHVRRAGRQLVEEQAERLGLLRQQDARRAEHRALADDARNAADVLRRDLRAEQRAARQARLGRRLVDHLGLADAGRRQQQEALLVRHALDQLLGLAERDGLFESRADDVHGAAPCRCTG